MHQLRTRGANFRESVCGYLNWAFVETTIRSNKPATPRTTEEEQSAQNDIIIIIPYVAECQKSSGGSSANIVFWCISNLITLRQKQKLAHLKSPDTKTETEHHNECSVVRRCVQMCTLVTQNNKFKIACDSIGQDTAVYLQRKGAILRELHTSSEDS